MGNKQQAYLVDGIRTAIGKFRGSLSTVRPDDLGARVIRALLERNKKIDATKIDDVILGVRIRLAKTTAMSLACRCCWRVCPTLFREKLSTDCAPRA